MKRTPVLAVALVALVALVGGCRRPALAIAVTMPDGYDDADLTLDLRVYAPGNPDEITCASLLYDELTLDALAAALVTTQRLEDTEGEVTDFPVFGEKLVIVEARDADGAVAMRGCTPQGELDFGPQALTVELALAAEVAVDGEVLLDAEVGQPLRPVRVTTVDYRGDPAADVAVRLRMLGPGDRILDEVEQVADDDGVAELAPTPAAAGPFRLEVRAAVMRGTAPASPPGLALPADTVVDPFGRANEDWLYVLPTRFKGGVAFVARSNELLNANADVLVARALPGGGFEDTGLDPGVATLFAGSYVRSDDGRSVLVFSSARSALGLVLLHEDGEIQTVTFPERYQLGRVLPIGPCDDDGAGPALMALVESDGGALDGLGAPTHLTLLPENGGEAPVVSMGDERFDPLLTTCREVDGVTYRVLVARAAGRLVIRGVAGGVTTPADLSGLVGNNNPLPGALVAGLVEASDDGDLVTARLAGFSTVVELQTTVTAPGDGFALQPRPAFVLPALPSLLAAAPLLGGSPVEVTGVFSAAAGAEEGLLMLGAHEPEDEQWTVGAAPLSACAASTCALEVADLDDDGTWELYVGMGYKLERAGPAVVETAQVIAFE